MKNPLARLIAAGMLLCAIGFGTAAHAADEPAKAPAATVLAAGRLGTGRGRPGSRGTCRSRTRCSRSSTCRTCSRRTGAVPNKGDTAWMMVATMLVIMMTIPGLALFYGGLVRSKNMLSVLMQVFMVFSLIMVLWASTATRWRSREGGSFIG